MLNINCKKFTEDSENLSQLRYYCGSTICADKNSDFEEFTFWPVLFNNPFKLLLDKERNLYTTCYGYFANYYNTIDECPYNSRNLKSNQNMICKYSPYVKINPYGYTNLTLNNSQCGLSAVNNIMDSGVKILPDEFVNLGGTKGYYQMLRKLKSMGYAEGFSIGANPYDFRKFVSTNDNFIHAFRYQVESLYERTGKKVIVIAHSYGTVNTYNQIIQDSEATKKNKEIYWISHAGRWTWNA